MDVFDNADKDTTLFTPQDAIIAQVQGKASPLPRSSVTTDSLPPSSSVRPGPTLTIYDPFSGAKLGEHTPITPSTATPSSFVPPPTADDQKLWSSLERILGLQAEIAAMHADMEDVGSKSASVSVNAGESAHVARKRSRRGQTLPIGDEEVEEHTTAVSEISTEHSEGDEDDEDDENDRDGKKRRDEEFARLAEQFAQRKAAIGGIMSKLDDLSMALKTFHALPPPLFEPVSRTNTMSSTASVRPGPSRVAAAPPLSPPVPPASTLAGDPSTPPGFEPISAPVLPRAVLPTIISEAPPVESPADMDPAESLFVHY